MDCDINEVKIASDLNKKPYLVSFRAVYFNITHSADYAMIAIRKSPLGIDIEYVNKDFNYKDLLSCIFNQKEFKDIKNCSDKGLAFYKLWT